MKAFKLDKKVYREEYSILTACEKIAKTSRTLLMQNVFYNAETKRTASTSVPF